MRHLATVFVPLTLFTAVPSGSPRETRETDFETAMAQASVKFERRNYLGASAELRKALQVTHAEFREATTAALPAPPSTMKPVRRVVHPAPDRAPIAAPVNPLSGVVPTPVEADFHDAETNERLKIRVVPEDQRALGLLDMLQTEGQFETFGDSERPFIVQQTTRRIVVRTVLGANHGLDIIWWGESRENLDQWLASTDFGRLERAVTGR